MVVAGVLNRYPGYRVMILALMKHFVLQHRENFLNSSST